MRREIKYIGFYDFANARKNRVSSLAAINKMDYIANAIIQAGFNVHIISPSWSNNKGTPITTKGEMIELNMNKKVTFCPTFSTQSKIFGYLKIVYSLSWLFCWLIKNAKRNEKIIVYHVHWLSLPIRLAKKIKKFQLVLEVEEIYGDISIINSYLHKLENDLIKSADSYFFSTDLLKDKIKSEKPFIVIYGSYTVYPQLTLPLNDGKIHLLYAGIIDTHKAGAFNALGAAKYLSNNYTLHIIGFGNTDLLLKEIDEINKLDGCKVVFDGLLSGEDYIRYCQKCHIGLSTQNSYGKYLESSFPSKILSYLGMGLNVVTGYIDCVNKSKIADIVNYYYVNSPTEISKAIKSVKIENKETNINVVNSLNDEFVLDVNKLLSNN